MLAPGALVTLLAATSRGGAEAPELLRIVAPGTSAPVAGSVVLRAEVHPSILDRVVQVSFRVDGQAVCTREAPPFECEWDAGRASRAHVVRAAARLAGGGRLVTSIRTPAVPPMPPPATVALTLSAEVHVVQVVATVTDRHGRFVPSLPVEAFRIQENGVPQVVTHMIGQDSPREIVVAIDMSRSMAGSMEEVRRAARSFLTALRPDDRVTLLAFNDVVFALSRRENDQRALLRAVDRLAPWGATALYDVMIEAMNLLSTRRGRKLLVVFTDGEDQTSRAGLKDVERRAETNDAPIFMIGQGRGTTDPELQRVLERLAAMSGGRAFHTDDARKLEGVFARIVEELDNQYLLGYQPENMVRDGSWRQIQVEIARQPYSVRARQGYRALAPGLDGQ